VNPLLDLKILGWLTALIGAFQLVPVAAALLFGEPVLPYLVSAAAAAACGMALALLARPPDRAIRPRDGFLVVACAWLLASLFGALPYWTTRTLGPVDALFESISGFTTTGSTVMSEIEGTQRALLLWRSFTQWLGGMGIILFTIAILPLLGIGGMQLFKAEVPGPVKDKLRPRVAETARRLWLVYVGFTAAEWIALRLAGMGGFDALCHSLTTLATGGFSTRNASIGAFDSAAVEWIVILFMLLAAINFVLHYRVLSGHGREVWRDSELRYFLVVIAAAGLVTVLLLPSEAGRSLEETLRTAYFQVISIVTTTGYGTTDFELWPVVAHLLILQLMILGGMAGSTGGGVKSLRALIGIRVLLASFDRLLHPHSVRPVKYGGRPVPVDLLAGIWAFFTGYFAIAVVAAAVVAASGYEFTTAISSALTAIGNVGPGLGEIGPYDNFAHFPAHVKMVLSFCMIAGRLEVFTLLVLLYPAFWRR
jgi:trk system potassium uptake protein TrkH